MYYYKLLRSNDGLNYSILSHEKKFAPNEFVSMYNEVIDVLSEGNSKGVYWNDIICNEMCEKYGFNEVNIVVEISVENGNFAKLSNIAEDDLFSYKVYGYSRLSLD